MSWQDMVEWDRQREMNKLSPEDREFAEAEYALQKKTRRGNRLVLVFTIVSAAVAFIIVILGTALKWWVWDQVFHG